MKKTPSNKALIKKLTGDTIDNAFLICAMEKYCQTVLEDGNEWENLMINKDLWQVIAKRNLKLIEEHYS